MRTLQRRSGTDTSGARKSGALLAAAWLLLVAAGACGGSDDAAENRRWAKVWCAGLATWQASTTASSAELQEYLGTPNLDTTATKARLSEYLEDATDSVDRLIRALRRAGAPAIAAKRQAVRTLENGSTAVQEAIADARATVDTLPADDGAAFQAGIVSANTRLSEGFASFGDALDRVNRLDADGELVKAERSVRACRPLAP